VSDVISEVVFRPFWLMLLGLGPTTRPKYFAEVFIGTRLESESFEPCIDFLAFLVQKF